MKTLKIKCQKCQGRKYWVTGPYSEDCRRCDGKGYTEMELKWDNNGRLVAGKDRPLMKLNVIGEGLYNATCLSESYTFDAKNIEEARAEATKWLVFLLKSIIEVLC